MQWTYMVDTCTRFRRIFAPLDMDLLGVFSATIWTCNDASSGKLRRPSAKASTGKKREQKKLISFLRWHGLLSPHCGAMYTKLHSDSVDKQTTAAAILKTFLIHFHIDIRRATSARVRERFLNFSLPISCSRKSWSWWQRQHDVDKQHNFECINNSHSREIMMKKNENFNSPLAHLSFPYLVQQIVK